MSDHRDDSKDWPASHLMGEEHPFNRRPPNALRSLAEPLLPPPAPGRGLGMGHIPDPPDPRDWPAGPLLGAPSNLPRECLGMRQHVRRVLDQKGTNQCVGCAIASGIDVRRRKLADDLRAASPGLHVPDPEEPSSQGIYTTSRAYLRGDPNQPLVDVGTNPRAAFLGIMRDGVPRAADWPINEAAINAELPWDLEQQASAAKVDSFRRLDTQGDSLVLEACNALSQGYVVPYASLVDAPFEAYSGKGAVGPATGEILGGHYTLLVGYVLDSATGLFRPEDVVFLALNSWSAGWGEGGYYWMRSSRLTAGGSGDAYILEVSGPDRATEAGGW